MLIALLGNLYGGDYISPLLLSGSIQTPTVAEAGSETMPSTHSRPVGAAGSHKPYTGLYSYRLPNAPLC